jgi:hypothetical protein
MRTLLSISLSLGLTANIAIAQDAEAPLATIELNTLEQVETACRMTFTAQAAETIDQLVAETVLFDTSGAVKLLTLFDFRSLPGGKVRVRQFDIPATDCDALGRILFNGVDTCTGANCADKDLSVGSRMETVEVLG